MIIYTPAFTVNQLVEHECKRSEQVNERVFPAPSCALAMEVVCINLTLSLSISFSVAPPPLPFKDQYFFFHTGGTALTYVVKRV